MHNPIVELAGDPAGTAERLAAMATIPGAAVAGIVGSTMTAAAAGVAVDEPLRPGSLVKIITATAVMQCVEDGLVALNDPALKYVPELRLTDAAMAGAITVGHLLSHSSGIDASDVFVDTGDGDDCLERYVEAIAGTGFLFEPGSLFCYCNAGFVMAGLIAARARQATWEDVMRAHILDPLGMADTAFLPAARDNNPIGSRALGPAGGTMAMPVADLGRFVTAHLAEPGVARLLSAESVAQMRRLRVRATGGVQQMAGPGLGWFIWRSQAGETLRNGGGYPGYSAVIAIDLVGPAAVVIMANSALAIEAIQALLDGGDLPSEEPPAPDDLSPYAGRFVSHAMDVTIEAAEGGLAVRLIPGADPTPLVPEDRTTFQSGVGPFAFVAFDEHGVPGCVRWRMRVLRRRA